ncbi:MAG: MFS transporter [Clostridia bacterium]|nr:MFS transporter [Clostridia bacterium]
MTQPKYPRRFWSALVLFSLIGQVAWVVENMYLNVFIYKMFDASASAISTMVAASSVAATVTTVLIGALSDKLGKRKLFICGGYIVWGISIACFALIRVDILGIWFPSVTAAAAAGVSLVIALDCLMTFFGSAANDACFNAWLTDSTDETGRGAAEGINSMMPLVAILVVFGGFMAFDLDKAESWTWIFLIIGGGVLIAGLLGLWLIRETPVKNPENQRYFQNIFYGFRPSVIRGNAMLYVTLLAFAVFGISIQIFMPYLILYYEVSLGMADYVLVMAPAILLASVATALYGRVYDRVGYRGAVVPALLMLAAGYVVLFLFKNTLLVFVGSLLMMCGYLCGSAVFGAMIRDCTPKGKAGMFQGLRIFGQVLIPGMIGPMIGAAVLANAETVVNNDGTTSFIPNENIFLAALVAEIALAVVLAITFAAFKKEKSHE